MGRTSNDLVSNEKLLKLYVSKARAACMHTYPYYFTSRAISCIFEWAIYMRTIRILTANNIYMRTM